MHIIFIEFFHGKHSNARYSCSNEISFMYKIKLSPSPCFFPDIEWPQRVRMNEESAKIYHSIFAWTDLFALIRWPTINLKLISLFFRNFVSRCIINFWTLFVLDIRLLIIVITKNFRFIAIQCFFEQIMDILKRFGKIFWRRYW